MSQILAYSPPLIHDPYFRDMLLKAAEEQGDTLFVPQHAATEANYRYFGIASFRVFQDRYGTVPHHLNMRPYTPPPALAPGYNKTFAEVCLARAQEILDTGKRVHLLWSGGLDSTSMLGALRYLVRDRDQLKIICTYESIWESGPLFDRYIKNDFEYQLNARTPEYQNLFQMVPEGELLCSGQAGDQILGGRFTVSGDSRHPFNDSYVKPTWRRYPQPYDVDLVAKECRMDLTKILSDELLDFMGPSMQACPMPIETLGQFQWFVHWNWMWMNAKIKHLQSEPIARHDDYISFYSCDMFELWSMMTQGGGYFSGEPLHKQVQRDAVREFLPAEIGYTTYKLKGVSTAVGSHTDQPVFCRMTDGREYYLNSARNVQGPKHVLVRQY